MSWRTHRLRPEKFPGEFECCQDVDCSREHYMSGFDGSYPTTSKWEGIKHGHK